MADRSADWVDQAQRDLAQAEQSMQAARHKWACFAAHQAVEALKPRQLPGRHSRRTFRQTAE